MWPFEQRRCESYLRLGARRAEHWHRTKAGFVLQASVAVSAAVREVPMSAAGAQALGQLLHAERIKTAHVLVESALAPVLLVQNGGLTQAAAIEALVRHRLSLLYARQQDPVSQWQIRLEGPPGRQFVLGYGLSPLTKDLLLAQARIHGVHLKSLVPASAWGWTHAAPPKRYRTAGCWWVWPEQDRQLLLRVDQGAVVGLNAAVRVTASHAELLQEVAAQRVRLGIEAGDEPVHAVCWSPDRDAHLGEQGGIHWTALTASDSAAPRLQTADAGA